MVLMAQQMIQENKLSHVWQYENSQVIENGKVEKDKLDCALLMTIIISVGNMNNPIPHSSCSLTGQSRES